MVVAARIVRAFAFGLMSVGLALYLAERGLHAFAIGIFLTLALLAGAAFLLGAPLLVGLAGQRNALLLAALAMCASGILLGISGPVFLIAVACLLGTLSAGGQEAGPFAAIEQHAVFESRREGSAHYLAIYNLAGAFALALGALAAVAIPTHWVPWSYAACGMVLVPIYAALPNVDALPKAVAEHRSPKRWGAIERLSMLYAVDALAGGFVVQSFLAYWLHIRFGADQHSLGLVFFGANTLSALSYPVAAWLSTRIGLLRTMVFTHLPSNVLLCAVPMMPTFALATAVLLLRFALSQMDVPTRQAFTLETVAQEERTHAAALTNAVRPAAAAIAPVFAGLALQSAAFGLPFFIAGGLKIIYDIAMLNLFAQSKALGKRAC